MVAGQVPVVIILTVVLSQQRGYLIAQDGVQLSRTDILVTTDALLDALNNLQSRVNAHVRGDEHLLQIVQHVVVNL